ncbi:MAG: hypothetical protein COT74_06905 [Bdellovibrionales bacterium CG10_big_fil_rev_8_21_14_0_10_45_34]|nr:MAG: hypothetical protein COT74_06905 [Bdellovibrionales bacterium CG10_big_fil_rev_8_21_14_0_10_45_34]
MSNNGKVHLTDSGIDFLPSLVVLRAPARVEFIVLRPGDLVKLQSSKAGPQSFFYLHTRRWQQVNLVNDCRALRDFDDAISTKATQPLVFLPQCKNGSKCYG